MLSEVNAFHMNRRKKNMTMGEKQLYEFKHYRKRPS